MSDDLYYAWNISAPDETKCSLTFTRLHGMQALIEKLENELATSQKK